MDIFSGVLMVSVIAGLLALFNLRGVLMLFVPSGSNFRQKNNFRTLYWILVFGWVVFLWLWLLGIRVVPMPQEVLYRKHFVVVGAVVLMVLPILVFAIFLLTRDLLVLGTRCLAWLQLGPGLWGKRFKGLLLAGALFALLAFSWIAYGMVYGRYHFKVETVNLWFDDLPPAFEGYRVVHFSDTHLGSFPRKAPVERGIGLINDLSPHLVVFTGDLINNNVQEATAFIPLFSTIEAPDGVFSVLGNHDLGDYRAWSTIDAQIPDRDELDLLHRRMGFHLLRNASHALVRRSDTIYLLGVDHWGRPPFAQYGDLQESLSLVNEDVFKILLSHDPSHWREEVVSDTRVQLTLSGHTHAMQLGLITSWFRWSPSSWLYPEWSGLYAEGDQKLYVNQGFGFVTFPGRMGVRPEITLFVLNKTEAL